MKVPTAGLVRFFERWMPDSFAIAVGLTGITFALSLGLTPTTPTNAIEAWGDGFWTLLEFTNQIALTLLLGYAVANTRPIRSLLLRAAMGVRSARAAYIVVCTLTGVLALLSWSLALVAAGIGARAVAEACRQRGIRVHFPLLVASAFAGFVVWHQGLSGSIGLTIATPGHFLEDQIGLIPTSQTLFATWNLLTVLIVIVTLPLVMASMHPADSEIEEMPEPSRIDAPPDQPSTAADEVPLNAQSRPAERFERSRWLALAIVGLGAAFLYIHYAQRHGGLTLNTMNFMLLMIGILFAGNLQRYSRLLGEGSNIAVPFLLQYPFYAGIAGLIANSGLGRMAVELFSSHATVHTLPLIGFLSAGLLNLFIPSGGGQWAVQGPIMMSAAQAIGADLPLTAMSVALGDQWTNLIQPLILLPVLTLARVNARAIMGYSFIAMLWSGIIFATALLIAAS